jgi:hypothetical protein
MIAQLKNQLKRHYMKKRELTEAEKVTLGITMAIFDASEAYRRENIALRNILRKQGLSDRAISEKVRRFLMFGVNYSFRGTTTISPYERQLLA